MQAVARAKEAGFTLLGSGGLEYLEDASSKVKHGDRVQLVLVADGVDPQALAASVEDTARAVGFTPPDGEDVMAWVDPHGQTHLRLQERSPEMTMLAPILLIGMAGLPVLFFLFKENQEQTGIQKWMPFLVLGGIVALGVVLAMATSK